ncbi:MAG: hypothetical protein M1360_03980 [Candidatus Marsarchaeota archaeon]|jgi:putative protease|nr:hypothetical protein [Candidatus Marsarchaeota archaeon]MCL5419069.1 hypothetical protein [Candidatus Marsarchaeota archaeon]
MPEKVKVGMVEHYYEKIGVAAVELEGEIAVGDTLVFKQGDKENEQKVLSMQINHINVEKGFKGDSVGIKVDAPVDEGSEVYKEL